MKAIILASLVSVVSQAAAEERGWIRMLAKGTTVLCRPDGSQRTESQGAVLPFRRQLSPDGASIVYVSGETIHVADRDGKHARRVSPEAATSGSTALPRAVQRLQWMGPMPFPIRKRAERAPTADACSVSLARKNSPDLSGTLTIAASASSRRPRVITVCPRCSASPSRAFRATLTSS